MADFGPFSPSLLHLSHLAVPSSQPSLASLRAHAMTPSSPPTSPPRPTPGDLQSHLYASFLQRKTADVALRVSGSWHAIYHLHRVILIQAGFFQSLFTSGFAESRSTLSGHKHGGYIDVVFDDPNITRAAFEVCIARLYGGGPPLWISPTLIPTPNHPLTTAFASSGQHADPFSSPGASDLTTLPPGHHPATPRFLLSLLATSVFLSIPSVASQALSAVLRTVGPHTAVRYLGFAIGRGIGPVFTHEYDGESDPEAAVGLEEVAELYIDEDASFTSTEGSVHHHEQERERHPEPPPSKRQPSGGSELSVMKEDPASLHPPDSDSDSEAEQPAGERDRRASSTARLEPSFYYGAVSDKVGEAAGCWLARWGVDMLRYEEAAVAAESKQGAVGDAKGKGKAWSPPSYQAQWGDERPGSAPPGPEQRSRRSGQAAPKDPGPSVAVPVIWRRGGLSARWVRGVLSSDAFFVKNEKERYDAARSVVEMRRCARQGGDSSGESGEEEEMEFGRMFREGIYYANMYLEDLMSISRDISPSTGQPYVPLATVQAAHWNQSTLYHRITSRPLGSSPPTSPTSATKDLGLGISTADISRLAELPDERDRAYYPIPADSSLRLGDSNGVEGASMDQLFEVGSSKKHSEANFFGLEQARKPASGLVPAPTSSLSLSTSTPPTDGKWTAHPPFRFAVEFWDVDALKEKSRLHSHTIWYAGSLYNVYVQVVRKKGVQLGVYLHRQSSIDQIPPSSAPFHTAPLLSSPRPPRNASSSLSSPRSPTLSGSAFSGSGAPMSPLPRASTPGSTPSTPLSSSLPSAGFARSSTSLHSASTPAPALPLTAPPVAPPQPYRDPRPSVSAYFTIACASATGASLTRFTSAPDVFSVSQSWGWKSSSLRTEEYLDVDAEGAGAGAAAAVVVPAGREVSLRATVVLGVV